MNTRTSAGFLGASTAALVLLLGCGNSEGGADDVTSPAVSAISGSDVDLTVEARDIDFDADAYTVAAGEITVRYVDEGSQPHTLVIEEVPENQFKLGVNGAQPDEDEGTVTLEAGTYALYCDVPAHRQAGMEAVLTVE